MYCITLSRGEQERKVKQKFRDRQAKAELSSEPLSNLTLTILCVLEGVTVYCWYSTCEAKCS